MSEKEKLIKLILKMDITDTAGNIVDFLIANGVRLEEKQAISEENKRWIPVTERLPHEEDLSALGEVLVMRKDDVCAALYLPSRSEFYRNGYRQDGVTHWMPMPEKLKEVE